MCGPPPVVAGAAVSGIVEIDASAVVGNCTGVAATTGFGAPASSSTAGTVVVVMAVVLVEDA